MYFPKFQSQRITFAISKCLLLSRWSYCHPSTGTSATAGLALAQGTQSACCHWDWARATPADPPDSLAAIHCSNYCFSPLDKSTDSLREIGVASSNCNWKCPRHWDCWTWRCCLAPRSVDSDATAMSQLALGTWSMRIHRGVLGNWTTGRRNSRIWTNCPSHSSPTCSSPL